MLLVSSMAPAAAAAAAGLAGVHVCACGWVSEWMGEEGTAAAAANMRFEPLDSTHCRHAQGACASPIRAHLAPEGSDLMYSASHRLGSLSAQLRVAGAARESECGSGICAQHPLLTPTCHPGLVKFDHPQAPAGHTAGTRQLAPLPHPPQPPGHCSTHLHAHPEIAVVPHPLHALVGARGRRVGAPCAALHKQWLGHLEGVGAERGVTSRGPSNALPMACSRGSPAWSDAGPREEALPARTSQASTASASPPACPAAPAPMHASAVTAAAAGWRAGRPTKWWMRQHRPAGRRLQPPLQCPAAGEQN